MSVRYRIATPDAVVRVSMEGDVSPGEVVECLHALAADPAYRPSSTCGTRAGMEVVNRMSSVVGGDESLTVDAVRAALEDIPAPGATETYLTGDRLRDVSVCGTRVAVHLAVEVSGSDELASLEHVVRERLRSLGASGVELVIRRPERSHGLTPHHLRGAARDPWGDRVRLSTVRHVVAVGAGKGGVGKSTVAENLALALARDGLDVGLLDADIYGPSLPILLGVEDGAARTRMTPEKHILPLEALGVSLVSFGFFLGEASPAIWRGPMVAEAVRQFARGVAWPPLDVLVVDLPPGTGDVPLSLAQAVELSGAVVVTQPARVATAEARKAVQMFAALDVPVLGVVENMTGPFGSGAGRAVSVELGVPFLGEIPFDSEVVRECDAGTPTVTVRPGSVTTESLDRIAQHVAEALGWRRVNGASPPAGLTHAALRRDNAGDE
jgi:ATP-binding protein involved in chromosome partitioning